MGCGGAADPGQASALARMEQGAVCLDCEGGGGGEKAVVTPMDLPRFQELAGTNMFRCNEEILEPECQAELNDALAKGFITRAAYDWGWQNGFYPIVSALSGKVAAVCKCGCFEGNALILSQDSDGVPAWFAANKIKDDMQLVALDDNATLSTPTFASKTIKALTHGEERPALYVFNLDNGRKLKVTQNHGMLLSDGRVVEAKTLGVGAEFVAMDGSIVRVTNLDFEFTDKEVYNFEVNTQRSAGHIIAAEGVLVGDLAWQNQLGHELGSIAVRR